MEAMEAGTLVADKYQLIRTIGRGGMGAVWAAVNIRTEREVALKLITDENPDYRARLLREARACGRISHRNVIEIYDVGETASGAPFLVMPLLDGEPLSRRLRRERMLHPTIAAQIGCEMACALSAAHAVGIVHRDLKPANVFLHHEPGAGSLVVKVLDFGISKVVETDSTTTTTGTILGSPAYMSPEQARGERDLDHRADLWSLGVALFEMLAGRRPFLGESMFTVVAAVLDGPIPRLLDLAPHVDPGLADVVARCMERDLSRRAQSADEIAYLLRHFAAGYVPLDQAFGGSGYHPAPSLAPTTSTGPSGIESASVPPVHFAAHAPQRPPGVPREGAPFAQDPRAIPPARGPELSVPSLITSSNITLTPVAPEPFSGSTTAASSMVRSPAPHHAPALTPAMDLRPQGPSQRTMWILGSIAFVAVASFVGVAVSVLTSGPNVPATTNGAATTTATTTANGANTATANGANTATANGANTATATATATGEEPAPSATVSTAVSGGASAPRSAGTFVPTAKPTASSKPGKPGKVGVPDDPG